MRQNKLHKPHHDASDWIRFQEFINATI